MSQVLIDCINYLFDNYAKAKNESFTKHPTANYIRNTIPNIILNSGLIDQSICEVNASPGSSGNWATVPWIRISRTAVSKSAQEGVYIVYLLSADCDTIFLTLNQGCHEVENNTTQPENSTKESAIVDSLRNYANHCVNILNNRTFGSGPISLGKNPKKRGKNYEQGTIFYKEYKKGAIPTEEVLEKDLKDMLEIYEEYYNKIFLKEKQTETSQKNSPYSKISHEETMQKILFGAPGTGKSFKVDDPEKGYGLKDIDESHKFRTTFHPDYDYTQFVGAYKPKPVDAKAKKTEITYSFVPQVFAKAYATAWKLYLQRDSRLRGNDNKNGENDSGKDIQVYLVIEEINRGNCAQIFGDIFQLLDRVGDGADKGFSQYAIDANCDFAEWLKTDSLLNEKSIWAAYEKKVGEGKLKLPPNLNILATMNTSDQSLFPMDSAFKRRFDWEYVPIKYERDATCGAKWNADQFVISVGNSCYMWLDFLKAVNKNVYDVTKSEDKQMGEFFIKHSVDYKEFRSKVLFYLWDSVYKDEEGNEDAEKVFHFKLEGEEDKTLTFQTLSEGDENTQKAHIEKIMSNLGVVARPLPAPQREQGTVEDAAEPAPTDEANDAQ